MSVATVGVRELKNQLSAFLDRVKAGEEITVTEHGRPIARLTSMSADVDRMAALVDAGIVRPARRERRLPTKRVSYRGESSIVDEVAQQRR
jgi:prevent-host-death family protein